MSASTKDTVYIDIDDEITAIIDKVQSSPHRIVALVLPKRAAVLQSIVNMKLLKRTADESKKHIVLITSESSVLPLAGAVGLHVAKTLQTKPSIPPPPKAQDKLADVDGGEVPEEDVPLDATKPVGVLAGTEETIEVDNSDQPDIKIVGKKSKPTNKKLKIPNFNKFRTRLFLGVGALVLIIVFWVLASVVWPKARIVIKTDTQSITSEINFTTQPGLDAVDLEQAILPSVVSEVRKTDTEKVVATGQKDVGTRATGTVSVRNCEDSSSRTVAAGTIFAANGKNYTANAATTIPAGTFSGGGSNCTSISASVPVTATENGDSYNQDAATYTSNSSSLQGDFRLSGSAMTGGTTKMATVVSQDDIDGGKNKITERNNDSALEELEQQLKDDGYYPLSDTVTVDTPTLTSSPEVDQEASEATITSTTTYTMIGIREDDLKALIAESVKDDIDSTKQSVQNDGLGEAIFRVSDKKPTGEASVFLQTIVVAGPQIDVEALKTEVAGKKRSETQKIIEDRPGVREVTVDYSPFWVYTTPDKTGKITIILERSDTNDAGQ